MPSSLLDPCRPSVTTTAPVPVRLRDSVMVFRRPGDVVDVVFTSTRKVATYQLDGPCLALLSLLDHDATPAELDAALAAQGFEGADVAGLLATFDAEGLLERDRVWGPAQAGPSSPYFDRRDRFLYELAFQAEGTAPDTVSELSQRLAAATVVVIGLGGMGTWLARSLAGVGVGRLVLCDPDLVAVENLAHQLLFEPADVGRPKVAAVAEALGRLCPATTIEGRATVVSRPADLEPMLGPEVDHVVAVGNYPSANALAALVAGVCQRHGIAHSVGAGYAHAQGSLGLTVIPGSSPCWECLQRDLADPVFSGEATLVRPTREPVGMIPMFPSILANHLAWEIVRVLLGAPPLLAGQACELDFATLEVRRRRFGCSPGCSCVTYR
jgi:hypothetical protein